MENNMNNVTVNKIKYENCTIIDRRCILNARIVKPGVFLMKIQFIIN